MSGDEGQKFVYKVVLTGGPCAGKTTTLSRVRTFFETLGWKVYTVPEAATILLSGGPKWAELTHPQAMKFQENILKTIMQLERTFFDLAEGERGNTIIICDRGVMDPSAFCTEEEWQEILVSLGLDSVQLRDARYDHVIHMVTAAIGAEAFYQVTNNDTRKEGIEQARERDTKSAQAWVGHPYIDIVDNSTDFENKIRRVIEAVCKRLGDRVGVDIDERLQARSRKRKFLIRSIPDIKAFPTKFQDFDVQHDYILGATMETQTRIRKRGQRGQYTWTLTERCVVNGGKVEQRRQLNEREYQTLHKQRDPSHHSVVKTRRCFLWRGHYFQLDIFQEPQRCHNLALLETFTTRTGSDLELPDFLDVVSEVSDNSKYSMFNLSDASRDVDPHEDPHELSPPPAKARMLEEGDGATGSMEDKQLVNVDC